MQLPDIISLPSNRVWRTYPGGRTLDELERKPDPKDSHFAEDWIASTTKASNKGREHIEHEGFSKVTIDGETHYLKNLFEWYPREILGGKHFEKYGANTQFLLKFLDSAIRLHIQAHPTIPFARKYLNSNSGKTEAYVILGSREDVRQPYIYLGFQHPLPVDQFKKAVLEQDIDTMLSCFEKIPVKPGDVFIVPGGLPHAIGEGVFMVEIMEPSDLAVRLEFERGGYVLPEEARFIGRDVDFAMDMIDFQPLKIDKVKEKYFCKPSRVAASEEYEEHVLIDTSHTPCFSVNHLKISGQYRRSYEGFHVGIVTKGNGIIAAGSRRLEVEKGDKFLVPFHTKEVMYEAKEEMEVVLTFPPA
jgi:mannose-6-phosphate isomerase